MTSRILPREEWDKLKGTEAELVTLGTTSTVVVVEDDEGQVVGCHVLQAVLHAECLWVHPDHRKKAAVARRLWWSVRNVAQQLFNAEAVWTASETFGPLNADYHQYRQFTAIIQMTFRVHGDV